jgi:hypothetical protein
MRIFRIYILFALFLLGMASTVSAVDIEFRPPDSLQGTDFWDTEGGFVGLVAEEACPPDFDLSVFPYSAEVGIDDTFDIKMTLPSSGLPWHGGIAFRFPHNFDLSRIENVTYSDDNPGTDPQINCLHIWENKIAICFEGGATPSVGTEVTLTISTIGNPTTAGQYRITGLIFNKFFHVVSGPIWSDYFDIYPADPFAIYIAPDEDLTLSAGEVQLFTARIFDEYGNEIGNLPLDWALSSESDDIGTIEQGTLTVSTTGTGRVVVSTGKIADTSGLITVIPGGLDHFVFLDYPRSVQPGQSFPSEITIVAYDIFDNLKYDYDGAVYFMSSDSLAEFYYDMDNKYDFTVADSGQHTFDGDLFSLTTQGIQTITITDGEVSATSGPILVGGGQPISFNIEYDDSVTAGQRMAIHITDAVDSTGGPATALINVRIEGDGTSPGGYDPIINDVLVIEGSGTAYQYLFNTGTTVLNVGSDSNEVEISTVVLPAGLGDLSLELQPTQFIGNKFYGLAAITAIDLYGNIKTDFDAETSPVTLNINRGELIPSVLNNSDDFLNGVADLTQTDIVFSGEAGEAQLYVSRGMISSNWVNVYFNGINMDVLRTLPDTVRIGFKGQFLVDLYNPGDLAPAAPISFELYFTSCTDNCTITGSVDSLPAGSSARKAFLIEITDDLNLPENDTFMVVMKADFVYQNDTVTTTVMYTKPIVVTKSVQFEYIDNSLNVDTVLSPSNLDKLTMQIRPEEGSGLDHPRIAAHIYIGNGVDNWIELYYSVLSTLLTGDTDVITLSFSNVTIPDLRALGWTEGQYGYLKMDGSAYDGGWYNITPMEKFDSVMVLYPSELNYVAGSITPDTVMADYAYQFGMDIGLDGSPDFALDRYQSRFELYHNDTLVTMTLLDQAYTLSSGNNNILTSDIYIPGKFTGSDLTPRLILSGHELYAPRVDTILFGDENISVVQHTATEPELRIISADLIAPNPPYLNQGQEFGITINVKNLSDFNVDSVSLLIQSEDGTDTFAVENDIAIAGQSDYETTLTLQAPDESMPLYVYKAVVTGPEEVTILPPEDNIVGVQVQSPAEIDLTYELADVYGDFVEYGQVFTINAKLENLGGASAGPGQVTLLTGDVDFGIDDSSSLTLNVGETGSWQLTAPSKTVTADLMLLITETPIDNNIAEPAMVKTDSIKITINVGPTITDELVGDVIARPSPLIIPGTSYILLGLEFLNKTGDSSSQIGLKSIILEFTDQHGNIIPAENIVSIETTGFKNFDSVITRPELYGERLKLNFRNFRLYPQQADTIYFFGQVKPEISVRGFGLRIDSRDIKAAYVTGPRVNQTVPVTGKFESNFRVVSNFLIVSRGLEQSLAVRNNPFNPEQGEAEITYNLSQDSDIEINIYTLLGEKVYRANYPAGSDGGRKGDNIIQWDGRNDEGRMVLNGVYVVVIEANGSGDSYKIKLAVMK